MVAAQVERVLAAPDRDLDLAMNHLAIEIARAGAAIVPAETRIILAEGNYLLLDEAPWNGLADAFDMTVWLDVPVDELERRLVRRWLDHGFAPEQARDKALSNDIPNARRVAARSRNADFTL